jgi:predicted lipoprotein with Yx(FWY)xxD motif
MKTLKILLAVALVVAVGFSAVTAQAAAERYFTVSNVGDATGPAATYLAFAGAAPAIGSVPHVTFLQATGDAAGSYIEFFANNGDKTTTSAAYTAGAKIVPTATTSAFSGTAGAGSWVMIVSKDGSVYEVNRVSSITSAASLNMVRNTVYDYPSGSTIYELASIGKWLVGNATGPTTPLVSIYGKPGSGLAAVVNGTSAASLNALSGDYVPQ